MKRRRTRRPALAPVVNIVDPQAYSIAEFCEAHKICRATFYNVVAQGQGPRVMKVGSRSLISKEAAADWRREREAKPAQTT